jgi:hypothetical protein
MSTENQATKVVIGPVRLSFAHIWEPRGMDDDDSKKKYSSALLIPKSEKKMIEAIEAAIKAAKEAGKSKWGGKIPSKLEISFKDGDVEKPDLDEYAGMMFINAKSSSKPNVVGRNRKPILDQEEVYSGCWAYVSINFYPYDTKGNKGVAAGLNNIMKWKDDEAFAGKSSAEEDFAGIEVSDDDDDLVG